MGYMIGNITIGNIDMIDWNNHDGVNLPMINDYMRNQFYDRILSQEVRDHRCIDVGFGTGLLSMLALKHGAQHVLAFENNPNRFQLGREIIERLGLSSKIDLVFGHFDCTQINKDAVVFTETVNGNLWQEGIWNSLPRQHGVRFLPSQYWLSIISIDVCEDFAKSIMIEKPEEPTFAPGVDVSPDFVAAVNRFMHQDQFDTVPHGEQVYLDEGINILAPQIDTIWGWSPYMRSAEHAGHTIAQYTLDAEQCTISTLQETSEIDWSLDVIKVVAQIKCPGTMILVPRVGIGHGPHRLILDTGHWGPCQDPVILHRYEGLIEFQHSLKDGKLSYHLRG